MVTVWSGTWPSRCTMVAALVLGTEELAEKDEVASKKAGERGEPDDAEPEDTVKLVF